MTAINVGDQFVKGDKKFNVAVVSDDGKKVTLDGNGTRVPTTIEKLLANKYVHVPSKKNGQGAADAKPNGKAETKAKGKQAKVETKKPAAPAPKTTDEKIAARPKEPTMSAADKAEDTAKHPAVPEFKAKLTGNRPVTLPSGKDVEFLKGRIGTLMVDHAVMFFTPDGPLTEQQPFMVYNEEVEVIGLSAVSAKRWPEIHASFTEMPKTPKAQAEKPKAQAKKTQKQAKTGTTKKAVTTTKKPAKKK